MTRPEATRRVILILLICLFGWSVLTGCATLGKEECLNADWRTIGYEDGAHGYPASRIGNHREACAKHGVIPDFDRYEQGRLQGLSEYCTPLNGYTLGTAGRSYTYVCPKNLEPPFMEGYRQGKLVHTAQLAVNGQEADLKRMYTDLDGVEKQLSDDEAELIKNGIGPQRRRYLLEEIKSLTDQQRAMIARIAHQESLLETSRQQLKELRTQKPY